MSEKINIIELNRRRIALAYLDFCQRHYGGQWVDVVISQDKGVRVELTQQSIKQCMVAQIEQPGREEFGRQAGDDHVTTLYSRMLSRNHSLTPLGATVMEEMIKAEISDALENPAKSALKVVAPNSPPAPGDRYTQNDGDMVAIVRKSTGKRVSQAVQGKLSILRQAEKERNVRLNSRRNDFLVDELKVRVPADVFLSCRLSAEQRANKELANDALVDDFIDQVCGQEKPMVHLPKPFRLWVMGGDLFRASELITHLEKQGYFVEVPK